MTIALDKQFRLDKLSFSVYELYNNKPFNVMTMALWTTLVQ